MTNTDATPTLVSGGFSDVDGSGQADAHAAYLERQFSSVPADQDRRAAEGRFQITTLWYLLTARKPATTATEVS